MKYLSTRGNAPAVDLSTALAAGLAPDGGLYVPAKLPLVDGHAFAGCSSLAEVGERLLAAFFHGDALFGELPAICAEAFDFPTPMQSLGDGNSWLLELFHGPTAAFKDVGAQFLAACAKRLQSPASGSLTILVATSGDTGAAVASAFHRLPGLRVLILYPRGRVSPRQAHQLGCFGDNISCVAVDGAFDDCQAMVKQALADAALQEVLPMSSANSISLGRLLPQMAYYAQAALAHQRRFGQVLNFIIPSGNLGNATAAAMARAIGLPIGSIALSSNANDVLAEFFSGGDYRPRASIATLANAMDVGSPSNFERMRWLYPDDASLRAAFSVQAVTDVEIQASIRMAHRRYGIAICPHTATAMHVLAQLRGQGDSRAWAVVSTAHPAKFDHIVEPLIGATVAVPPALAGLLARPSRAEPMAADYASLRRRLLQMAG